MLVRRQCAHGAMEGRKHTWCPILAAEHVSAALFHQVPGIELLQRLLAATTKANQVESSRVAPYSLVV